MSRVAGLITTKCCKQAKGDFRTWYSPRYGEFLKVRLCPCHRAQFDTIAAKELNNIPLEVGRDPIGESADIALKAIKPDQSRMYQQWLNLLAHPHAITA